MTYQLSTNKTPFNLAFKTKMFILLELGSPSYKVKAYDEHKNSENLEINVDLLKEV